MARLVLAMCVGTVLFLLACTSNAATIHVDGCAEGPGDGSQSDPHRTLKMAVDTATPGDTIVVQRGAYPESLPISKQLTVTASGGPVLVGEYYVASEEVCLPISIFFGTFLPQGTCAGSDESALVNAKLYYPSRDGKQMACGGPFPPVVYAHGFRSLNFVLCDGSDPGAVHEDYRQVEGILRPLAASGIVVISVDSSAADVQPGLTSDNARASIILNTIAYLRDENEAPDSLLKGVVDLNRLGLTAHSKGGRAATLAALALGNTLGFDLLDEVISELNLDDVHIRTLGLIAPAGTAGLIEAISEVPAVLVIHGTKEHPDQVNGLPVAGYVAARPPKHLVVVTGANHYGYTDGICLDPDDNKDNSSEVGGVAGQEAHARQQLAAGKYIQAFLSHYLQGKPGVIDHLIQDQGAQCEPGIPPDCGKPRRQFPGLDNLNVEVSVCSCTQ